MAENPSYYAIIPANIRYDNTLKANEKLLYGEITCLTQMTGKCFASNEYFANLYDTSKETISRWISNLANKGYIKTQLIYKEGTKQIINRYIQINQEGIDKKINSPIDENIKDNNTSINNTSINIKEKDKKENKPNSKKDILIEFLKSQDLSSINKKSLNEWLDYKKWNYKEIGIKKLIKFLSQYSSDVQVNIIDTSIMSTYDGLFPPKQQTNKPFEKHKYQGLDLSEFGFDKNVDDDEIIELGQ
jgi:hypothetical protein